jgi:hypothetical protein
VWVPLQGKCLVNTVFVWLVNWAICWPLAINMMYFTGTGNGKLFSRGGASSADPQSILRIHHHLHGLGPMTCSSSIVHHIILRIPRLYCTLNAMLKRQDFLCLVEFIITQSFFIKLVTDKWGLGLGTYFSATVVMNCVNNQPV